MVWDTPKYQKLNVLQCFTMSTIFFANYKCVKILNQSLKELLSHHDGNGEFIFKLVCDNQSFVPSLSLLLVGKVSNQRP